MENPRLLLTLPLIGLALLMGACESKDRKSTAARPPSETAPPPITATVPAPAPSKPADTTAQKPDAVDNLIAQAEQHYRQGQANYAAGHLESAKTDFDKAFDSLLQGPVEVHA